MARRIITTTTIDEALAAGKNSINLDAHDIVTPLAKDYALERGVRLDTGAEPGPVGAETSPEQVREAVIAQLGYEPAGLDAVIRRAMG